MRTVFIAALAAAGLSAGAAAAQDTSLEVGLPLVEGMEFDDTCGPRPDFQARAVCVRGALASIGPVAETYIGHFTTQGWQVVSGHNNSVIFARRRSAGGCDGLEMAAFYDESRPVAPSTSGWIAFAPIPGDICPATGAL
jgi:hypothetical protein